MLTNHCFLMLARYIKGCYSHLNVEKNVGILMTAGCYYKGVLLLIVHAKHNRAVVLNSNKGA